MDKVFFFIFIPLTLLFPLGGLPSKNHYIKLNIMGSTIATISKATTTIKTTDINFLLFLLLKLIILYHLSYILPYCAMILSVILDISFLDK
ncbi:hypothetical protein LAD12857_31340 [Lacrimispora amygdalina]|uniref:Uncharacterized protein n=1 Tax=Lacrimispora amygdalina TaxID=253257 RepID=A0ABQ5M8C7_9FIRM